MTMVQDRRITAIDTLPVSSSPSDISFGEIEACAREIAYPATKQQIVQQAKFTNSSQSVVAFFDLLPDVIYYRSSEIVFMAWEYFLI